MAPTGNTNALKHGLYAKRITPSERAALGEHADTTSLAAEIELLRVIINRAAARIKAAEKLAPNDPASIAAYAALLSSIAGAFSALSVTTTRQAIQTGTYAPLNDAITQFLDGFSLYSPDQDN